MRKDLINELVKEDIEETGELGVAARALRDLEADGDPTFHEAELGLKVIKAGLTKPTGAVGPDQFRQQQAVHGIYDFLWTGDPSTLPAMSKAAVLLLSMWAPVLRTNMQAVDAKGHAAGREVSA